MSTSPGPGAGTNERRRANRVIVSAFGVLIALIVIGSVAGSRRNHSSGSSPASAATRSASPTPERPATSRTAVAGALDRAKLILSVLSVLIALILIGSFAGAASNHSSGSAPASADIRSASPTPERPATSRTAVRDARDRARTSSDSIGPRYVVECLVSHNMSHDLIKTGTQTDAVLILTAIHDTGHPGKPVGIRGQFRLQEGYGDEFKGRIMWTHWKRRTLHWITRKNAHVLDVDRLPTSAHSTRSADLAKCRVGVLRPRHRTAPQGDPHRGKAHTAASNWRAPSR